MIKNAKNQGLESDRSHTLEAVVAGTKITSCLVPKWQEGFKEVTNKQPKLKIVTCT